MDETNQRFMSEIYVTFRPQVLDIRMASLAKQTLQVSLDEESVFIVLVILLITLASFLSKSLGFYYGSAMAVGSLIFLVILMVLFQVGVGSFFLRYVPQLLRSIINEIGIGEDMYNPVFGKFCCFSS